MFPKDLVSRSPSFLCKKVGVQLEYLGNQGLTGLLLMGNSLSGFLYHFLFRGVLIPALVVG